MKVRNRKIRGKGIQGNVRVYSIFEVITFFKVINFLRLSENKKLFRFFFAYCWGYSCNGF